MQKKGFIFDLDGVIVDTAGFHYLAWKTLANDLGFEFTEEQNERFKGVSRVRSLEILLEIGKRKATQEEKDGWHCNAALHCVGEDAAIHGVLRRVAGRPLPRPLVNR